MDFETIKLQANLSERERDYFFSLIRELRQLFGERTYEEVLKSEDLDLIRLVDRKLTQIVDFVQTKKIPLRIESVPWPKEKWAAIRDLQEEQWRQVKVKLPRQTLQNYDFWLPFSLGLGARAEALIEGAPQGVQKETLLIALRGSDSVFAKKTRRNLAAEGYGTMVLENMIGLDDDDSWALREKLGVNNMSWLIMSLPGCDSERAWEWRRRYKGNVPADPILIDSLIGLESPEAWEWRNDILEHSSSIDELRGLARSLVGLESEQAWKMRETLLQKDPRVRPQVIYSLAYIDTAYAWRWRDDFFLDCLNQGKKDLTFLWRSLEGLNSERAKIMREQILQQGQVSSDWSGYYFADKVTIAFLRLKERQDSERDPVED